MKTFFLLLWFFAWLFTSCKKETKATTIPSIRDGSSTIYTGPIIDMHLHAYNSGNPQFDETVNPVTREKRVGSKNPAAHKKETFEVMEKNKIVLAMVSAPDGKNEVLLDWRNEHPQKILIGQSVVNPDNKNVESLHQQFKEGKLDAIGEVMPNYAGILPTDRRLIKIFELAEQINIPLGYHLFPGGPPGGAYFAYPMTRAGQAKPLQMEELLIAHPNLRVYIMHAGWPFLEEMKALMYAHPQIYVDIGLICWYLPRAEFHKYLKGFIDAGFEKRIMFGSDQMTWPEEVTNGIEAVNAAPFLTMEQKADIFYLNAARFLELSQEQIDEHQYSSVQN